MVSEKITTLDAIAIKKSKADSFKTFVGLLNVETLPMMSPDFSIPTFLKPSTTYR